MRGQHDGPGVAGKEFVARRDGAFEDFAGDGGGLGDRGGVSVGVTHEEGGPDGDFDGAGRRAQADLLTPVLDAADDDGW